MIGIGGRAAPGLFPSQKKPIARVSLLQKHSRERKLQPSGPLIPVGRLVGPPAKLWRDDVIPNRVCIHVLVDQGMPHQQAQALTGPITH